MSLKTDVVSKLEKVCIRDFLKQKDLLYKGRREYKFLIPLKNISDIVDHLNDDYYCIVHDDGPYFSYKNSYFDSENFKLFNMHRQGKYNRLKIRIREYKSGKKGMYIESKRKANGARYTIKKRSRINTRTNCLEKKFIKEGINEFKLNKEKLEAKLHIEYNRFFLVSKNGKRRITIDFNVKASNSKGKEAKIVPNFAIFEVKQEGLPLNLMKLLRRKYNVRRTGFSKYCISVCTLFDNVRKNKWKQILKLNHS